VQDNCSDGISERKDLVLWSNCRRVGALFLYGFQHPEKPKLSDGCRGLLKLGYKVDDD
jgi:hypothetical protein